MNDVLDANAIIDRLGGTVSTAKICEIAPPSVSEWRAKNEIPKARLMFLKLKRPDVFVCPSPSHAETPQVRQLERLQGER